MQTSLKVLTFLIRKIYQNSLIDSSAYFRNSELSLAISKGLLDLKTDVEVLEIGTFEGVAALSLAAMDCVLSVYTVDPFPQSDETTSLVSLSTERNFHANCFLSSASAKVFSFKMTSRDFFEHNSKLFDLVYVDGSHTLSDVSRDLQDAFDATRAGGIIWIDDYGSDMNFPGEERMEQVIDHWISHNDQALRVIHRGYQVGVQKL